MKELSPMVTHQKVHTKKKKKENINKHYLDKEPYHEPAQKAIKYNPVPAIKV